eukprot:3291897-Pyramimonas_sp.AAC.1
MWEAKVEPDASSYSSGTSACAKDEQRQRALSLLSGMWEVRMEPNAISYNSGVSARANGEQRERALSLLSE